MEVKKLSDGAVVENCYPCKHSKYNKETGEMECWKDDTIYPFIVPREGIHPSCQLRDVEVMNIKERCPFYNNDRYHEYCNCEDSVDPDCNNCGIEQILIVRKGDK